MKKDLISATPVESIEHSIYVIRGQKVILDEDLAVLYGVETRILNQSVQRNIERFPEDFAFQLSQKEWEVLRSQIVISKGGGSLMSQNATSNVGRGGRRYLPFVFTEHGTVMAANLLKSERAIQVSVEIVRAFIRMREFLSSQKEITKELSELKSFLLKHSNESSREFRKVWQAIQKLSQPPKNERRIGFRLD